MSELLAILTALRPRASDEITEKAVVARPQTLATPSTNLTPRATRNLLQRTLACDIGEIEYWTICGLTSACNSGDRQLELSCDGCGFPCSTTLKAGTKERCCRRPTPSPSMTPNTKPTISPISSPPSLPSLERLSNCRLPPATLNLTSVSAALQALHAANLANRSASVMVTLRRDETLTAMVSLRSVDQLRIDGGGHKLHLSDFGFVVNGGQLCLHDVELTGGRNVPALVVLDATANVNTSHTRISYCMTRLDLTEIGTDAVSALDVCTGVKSFVDAIPAALWLLRAPSCGRPFDSAVTRASDLRQRRTRFFSQTSPQVCCLAC